MKIEVEKQATGHVVVRPLGRVDADSSTALKAQLRDVAKSEPKIVVVDLAAVDFIDSSGLSALISGLKALRQYGGCLNLSRPHPQALTALRLTMLDRVFPLFNTVEEALKQGDLLIP